MEKLKEKLSIKDRPLGQELRETKSMKNLEKIEFLEAKLHVLKAAPAKDTLKRMAEEAVDDGGEDEDEIVA